MSRSDDLRSPTLLTCVVAALLAMAAACSEPTEPTVPRRGPVGPAQPSPSSLRDGLWAGTTAEGFPVHFEIEGGAMKDLSITIDLTGDCGVDSFRASVEGPADVVVDQLIVVGDSANPVSLRGQFIDDATATGSARLRYVGKFADGTPCVSAGETAWTASRNW